MGKHNLSINQVLRMIVLFLLASWAVLSILAHAYGGEKALVGYWPFEEGSGKNTKGESGNKNDGALMGKVEWVDGKVGKFALNFVAKGSGHVEVPDSNSLDITDAITIAAWIKPSSIYIGGDWKQRNCVLGKPHVYYLDITEKGNLASYIYGLAPAAWLVGKTDMQRYKGNWVHVATVYNGKEHLLYIDGQKDATVQKTGKITVTADKVEIGWVDNQRYFDGAIDEVRLYNRALTASEISQLASSPVEPNGRLASSWGQIKAAYP